MERDGGPKTYSSSCQGTAISFLLSCLTMQTLINPPSLGTKEFPEGTNSFPLRTWEGAELPLQPSNVLGERLLRVKIPPNVATLPFPWDFLAPDGFTPNQRLKSSHNHSLQTWPRYFTSHFNLTLATQRLCRPTGEGLSPTKLPPKTLDINGK